MSHRIRNQRDAECRHRWATSKCPVERAWGQYRDELDAIYWADRDVIAAGTPYDLRTAAEEAYERYQVVQRAAAEEIEARLEASGHPTQR